jgi:hypothetical protein
MVLNKPKNNNKNNSLDIFYILFCCQKQKSNKRYWSLKLFGFYKSNNHHPEGLP